MNPGPTPDAASAPLDLIASSEALIKDCIGIRAPEWLLVDCLAQTLWLVREGVPVRGWAVSTSDQGLDNRDGSGGTPPGVHKVARKIGDGAPWGTVFSSREPTGEVFAPTDTPDGRDLILTRILVLDGCEEGVNRGEGVDSRARYIYVHGTNHEEALGTPVSHGCVRMANHDIMELFDQVAEGAPLVIV